MLMSSAELIPIASGVYPRHAARNTGSICGIWPRRTLLASKSANSEFVCREWRVSSTSSHTHIYKGGVGAAEKSNSYTAEAVE